MLNWLLAAASGAMMALAFPPFDLSWLAPLSLAPLLVALDCEPRPARRFLLGYAAGVIFWAGTCHWIHYPLAVHGNLAPAVAWGAVALLALIKGLHTGFFGLLASGLLSSRWAALAIPALWVSIERTHGPLGFAWLALGNAGIDMEIPPRAAPFTGVYGISFVFVSMGVALALVIRRRPLVHLAPAAALALLYALPRLPAPQSGEQTAVLVQPNISETADWTDSWIRRQHERLVFLSEHAARAGRPATLIVWPEVPAPVYYDSDPRFREMVNGLARRTQSWLLINAVPHAPSGAPLNSALLVSPEGRPAGRYDKMRLVPFGEYVPRPFGFLRKISGEAGDFEPGKQLVVLAAGGRRIGAFVCYEAVFPELVRRLAVGGAELLVNISNDGWYGRTPAREQHFKIARMRAVENRRWLLRATNDGITAAIDPAGRVRRRLPPFTQAAMAASFSWVREQTFYTRFGDWFVWLCALAAVTALIAGQIPRYRP
ncbi:MAG: apolipoprotein N-acyltransferase [Bryobacteraceae bacterium]